MIRHCMCKPLTFLFLSIFCEFCVYLINVTDLASRKFIFNSQTSPVTTIIFLEFVFIKQPNSSIYFINILESSYLKVFINDSYFISVNNKLYVHKIIFQA